jgi:hypothetical protein
MDPTFPYAGKVRIPPKQFQLRNRIENSTRDSQNARRVEQWETDVPDLTNNIPTNREKIGESFDILNNKMMINYKIKEVPYYDMNPTNTRRDQQDYKQSQQFVAGGPDLEHNPYFDRYDPVSDPRNAVRELRSAVYEDKGGDRGYEESQFILRRQFENRWLKEELIDEDQMDTFLRYEIATAGKSNI